MARFFNTAGPIIPEDHYHIAPLQRLNLGDILTLISQKKYFVLHAPRQTGKTSFLRALMDYLNNQGQYTCLHINVEKAQAARENVAKGIQAILDTLAERASDSLNDTFIKNNWRKILKESGEFSALQNVLKEWSQKNEKPVVLMIDEIDSLVGDTLISVLRQLRSGYEERPKLFPQSIILCGVRDVRDYRIHSDKDKSVITGGSAFNIKAESLRLGNFNMEEIQNLYKQHTAETGQVFQGEIFPQVWELTEGQPWLVNALVYEVCFKMKEGQDREKEITPGMFDHARESIILRRETHIDQLLDKLAEKRIKRVIEPLLSGSVEAERIPTDDIQYAVDLGIIKEKPQLEIANRIYKEIIPRELTYGTQKSINQQTEWYVNEDGYLDMDKLLTAFQDFFRKHFESWVDGFNYAEAGPQLLLQAFLQRVVNGGGTVVREYGLGRKRTDLLVTWNARKGKQDIVLELKVYTGKPDRIIEKGLEQTWEYMDKCGTREGYLLVFNKGNSIPWEDKVFKTGKAIKNTKIAIYGM